MAKNLVNAARVLLGLVFLVMGLNAFLHFIEMPSMGVKANAFFMALGSANILEVKSILEVVGGALLIAGYFVPLALTLLAPVIVNILLFHLFLAPDGLPMAFIITGLEGFLIFTYWDNFKRILEV